MITLYRDDIDDAKRNAQRNLSGRTHFVDEGTLRWHKSRVLTARAAHGGLLFAITVSNGDANGYGKRGREYLAVVFDVFGFVLDRTTLETAYPTHAQALKALKETLAGLDAIQITKDAIDRERKSFARELSYLSDKLAEINKGAA